MKVSVYVLHCVYVPPRLLLNESTSMIAVLTSEAMDVDVDLTEGRRGDELGQAGSFDMMWRLRCIHFIAQPLLADLHDPSVSSVHQGIAILEDFIRRSDDDRRIISDMTEVFPDFRVADWREAINVAEQASSSDLVTALLALADVETSMLGDRVRHLHLHPVKSIDGMTPGISKRRHINESPQ